MDIIIACSGTITSNGPSSSHTACSLASGSNSSASKGSTSRAAHQQRPYTAFGEGYGYFLAPTPKTETHPFGHTDGVGQVHIAVPPSWNSCQYRGALAGSSTRTPSVEMFSLISSHCGSVLSKAAWRGALAGDRSSGCGINWSRPLNGRPEVTY
ncbi:hypothetical protein [Parapedobacter sp.]